MDLWHALDLRDLTNPAHGPHAMQLLLDDVVQTLVTAWGCDLDIQRRHPIVSVQDNDDRSGYGADDVTRETRCTRYVSENLMLRSHTSAGVPRALRGLHGKPPRDLLLALPGMVHRRDSVDRLHVGTPHQVDLWRTSRTPMTADDLRDMVSRVVRAVLPGARWRTVEAVHPYTDQGVQVDVETRHHPRAGQRAGAAGGASADLHDDRRAGERVAGQGVRRGPPRNSQRMDHHPHPVIKEPEAR